MRRGLVVAALLLMAIPASAADRQIKPLIGVSFAGTTTLIDLENAAGSPHITIGVSTVVLGDIFGVDVDFAQSPGFFQSGDQHLVLRSRVTTLTGNIVVAMPRRLTEYTLRPYFVAGAGLMRASIDHPLDVLTLDANLPALDFGGGATGFVSRRVGLNWELRHFRSFGEKSQLTGSSFAPEELSFWRASMSVAIRY